MKTPLKITLLIVVASLVWASSISAQTQFNTRQQGAAFSGLQQRIEARIAERRAAIVRELALSSAQQAQWEMLGQRRTALMQTYLSDRSAFRERVADGLQATTALEPLLSEHYRMQDAHIAQRRQLQQDYLAFYNSLNAGQQRILREHLLEIIDRVEARRAR